MNTMVSCQPKIELTQELIYILDKIQKIHPTSQFSAHHHTKHQGRENKQSGFSSVDNSNINKQLHMNIYILKGTPNKFKPFKPK